MSNPSRAAATLNMKAWYYYAIGAAVLYGAHQIFTKMASERISDGRGGIRSGDIGGHYHLIVP